LWRIPSIDGFDGGVLPLQRYNQFAALLVAPRQLAPDGRLREQLSMIPPAKLLNLMNVQYLITDKVRDLWFEDVYYDRQIGTRLHQRMPTAQIPADEGVYGATATLEATHLDLIAYADAADAVWLALAQGAVPIASVEVRSSGNFSQTFTLTAGGAAGAQLADGRLDSPLAQSSGAQVAWRDVDAGRQEYRLRLAFDIPLTPYAITVRLLDERFAVQLQAATLYDDRTRMFTSLLPSDRGRFARVHSGDVKIYANRDLWPRAYVVTQTLAAEDAVQATQLLQTQLDAGNGAPVTVVEGLAALPAATGRMPAPTAQIVRYTAEEVEVRTSGQAPGLLVLSDSFYPGWRASVDGQETPIYAANILFRSVPVGAGEHTVLFTFEPSGWRLGLSLAVLGGLLALLFGLLAWWGIRRQHAHAV
jgi:hypothetical protein